MPMHECPSAEVLNRYALGDISEAEAQTLDTHLGACTVCVNSLDELARRPNQLVAALQGTRTVDGEGNAALAGAIAAVLSGAPVPTTLPGPEAGTVVNGYRILDELGRGGMGRVYRALHPRLDQEVALKLLRPGLDSAQVTARFEAERETLALMDHPHIARVLDGGATEDGQPFFVMELVRGVRITRHCDEHRLDIHARLELFIDACQAVQHAHQKGIIHRDLKPSNILVSEYDGKPAPKVIDFGVAKALERRSTGETEIGMLVGTLEYMSPEQADLTSRDVDTRSDIYALGVILYELLTGNTPLQGSRVRTLPVLEVLSLIREEEATPPSGRISNGRDRNGVPRAALSEPRWRELNWIVLHALDKERSRRYESAAAFAADVRRFLNDEPVQAGPPTRRYRVKKFIQRNRRAVLAASLVLATILAGTAGTAAALVRAREAEIQAKGDRAAAMVSAQHEHEARIVAETRLGEIEKANGVLQEIFRDIDPRAEERDEKPLRIQLGERLERAAGQLDANAIGDPKTLASLQDTLGNTQYGLGHFPKAIAMLTQSRETREQLLGADHPDTLTTCYALAIAYLSGGQLADAVQLHEETLARRMRTLGENHIDTNHSRNGLALAYSAAGAVPKAIALFEETVARSQLEGENENEAITFRSNLAVAYAKAGRVSDGIAMHEEILRHRMSVLGPDHLQTLTSRQALGVAYYQAKRYEDAIEVLEETLRLRAAKLGDDHPRTLTTRTSLANAYSLIGKFPEAIAILETTLKLSIAKLGTDHPATLQNRNDLATTYGKAGRRADSIGLNEENLRLRTAKLGKEHPETLNSMGNLAYLYISAKRLPDAERLLRDQEAIRRRIEPANSPALAMTLARLATVALSQKRNAEAETLLRESLTIRAQKSPTDWQTADTRARLGQALFRQQKYAEAEPLLLQGYEEINRPEAARFADAKTSASRILQWIVQLYEAWGKKDAADLWRAKLPPTAGA